MAGLPAGLPGPLRVPPVRAVACLHSLDARDFLRVEVAGGQEGARCVFSHTARGWKLTALTLPR
jgi:hypothetical protein